jgi:hypothetical protein
VPNFARFRRGSTLHVRSLAYFEPSGHQPVSREHFSISLKNFSIKLYSRLSVLIPKNKFNRKMMILRFDWNPKERGGASFRLVSQGIRDPRAPSLKIFVNFNNVYYA